MKKILLLLSLVCLAGLALAQIELYHNPPVMLPADDSYTVTLDVRNGFNDISKVWFFYRAAGELSYTEEEMIAGSESQPEYTFVLQDVSPFSAGLEYYFMAFDMNNIPVNLPVTDPELNPFRVIVEKRMQQKSPFVRLAPDADFSDNDADFFVAISYFELGDQLNTQSIRFMFNGKDVTDKITISSNMIVYKPRDIRAGRQEYQITATLKDGSTISSPKWSSTFVKKTFDLPLDMYGRATLNLNSYNQSADAGDENDFNSNLNFTLGGRQNWLRFYTRLYLSSEEDEKEQPVNRYTLKLDVPHFEFIAGDHTPSYGTFTTSGRNVRGIHANLRFKYFSLLTSFGDSRRAVSGTVETDEITGETEYMGGSFKRSSTNIRTEAGNPNSFLWGFTIAKSKDDIDSLDEEDYLNLSSVEQEPTVTPKDNIILSTDARLSLFRQRVTWGAEAALSLYNSNIIGGAISLDSLEAKLDQEIDLPFDPADLEDLFVINEFIEPIEPGTANLAYRTYMRMYFLKNLLNVSYSAIGTSYNALSANYLQKDSQVISVYDNLNLLNNRLVLTGGITVTSDNVYDTKEFTSTNTNYFVQLLARPNNLPYFNLGYNANTADNDASEDEQQKEIATNTITVGSGYTVDAIEFAPTNFTISYSNTTNNDEAQNMFENTRDNISLSLKSEYRDLPLETLATFSMAMSKNTMSMEETETSYNSFYLKGMMKFMSDRLRPYADLRLIGYGGDADAQSSQLMNLGASYNLTSNTFLSTNFGMKFYANDDVEGTDYSQFNWRFKVDQKF
jgi:hypothetical protein